MAVWERPGRRVGPALWGAVVLAVLLVLALIVYGLVSGGKEVDDRTAGLGESSLTEGADEHDHPGGCQVQCPARLLAVTCSPVGVERHHVDGAVEHRRDAQGVHGTVREDGRTVEDPDPVRCPTRRERDPPVISRPDGSTNISSASAS